MIVLPQRSNKGGDGPQNAADAVGRIDMANRTASG